MWGLHNKPRLCLFVMGKSGGTSCFSMIEQSDIIRATSLPNAPQMSKVDKRSRRSPVDYWTCGALQRGFRKIAEEQLSCRESFNRRGVCSLGIRIYALVRYKVLAKILCCFICVYKIYCVFLHSFM